MTTQPHLLYEDNRAQTVLEELPIALAKHNDQLLCSDRHPIPGLPCVTDNNTEQYFDSKRGVYVKRTPWGDVKSIYGRKLGSYKLHTVTPLFKLIEPNPDLQAQTPQRGYTVLDLATNIATTYLDDAEVHNTRVFLAGRKPKEVMKQVRRALAKDGVPVYPTRMLGKSSLPYPWEEDGGIFRTPRVANDNVSALLTGYAINPDTHSLVYLHMVGHKTALRSIWGTLNEGRMHTVRIDTGDQDLLNGYNSETYESFSSVIDAATNTYRMIIIATPAVAHEVEEHAYLVIPDGDEDLDIHRAFAARLNALLPIPILPEWGKALMEHGAADELITYCPRGGDVERVLLITRDGWNETVEQLLQGGDISLKSNTEHSAD